MSDKDSWVKTYDHYQKIGLHAKPSIFAEEVVGFFKDQKSLLDLGAGLGQDSRYFAEQGFSVTCTDVSEHALMIAKQNSPNSNINFKRVDLSARLPFNDGSFDVVYSHLALHYFDKETTANLFKEIHRILKSKGIFAALLNTIDDPEIKQAHFRKIEDNFYQAGDGQKKRYFCVKCLKEFTGSLFEDILADNRGRTYKDEIECLIKYVGIKTS